MSQSLLIDLWLQERSTGSKKSFYSLGDWNSSNGRWGDVDREMRRAHPRLVVHQHHGTPGLAEHDLRAALHRIACALRQRGHGCKLTLVTVMRDPVERAVSAAAFSSPWRLTSASPSTGNRESLCRSFRQTSNTHAKYLRDAVSSRGGGS